MTANPNRVALHAVREILEGAGAGDLDLEVVGTPVHVAPQVTPQPVWPTPIDGLDPDVDGPWPAPVRLACTWEGGRVDLVLKASWWIKEPGVQNVALRLDVLSPEQQLVWIDVAQQTRKVEGEGEVRLVATASIIARKGESKGRFFQAMVQRLDEVVAKSGLPMATQKWVDVARVRVPSGEVRPSAREAFERLVHTSLLKLPFLARDLKHVVQGRPLHELPSPAEAVVMAEDLEAGTEDSRYAGLWPLPGGVRRYKETLDDLLTWLQAGPRSQSDFEQHMLQTYDASGSRALGGYRRQLLASGLVRESNNLLELSSDGEAYLASRSPDELFEILNAKWSGLLECLVIAAHPGGLSTGRADALLTTLLDATWSTNTQAMFRRNWLLSLGMVERTRDGDTATEAGLATLERHAEEVAAIRTRLRELLDDHTEERDAVAEDDELEIPAAWHSDRLDLTGEQIDAHLGSLCLPPTTVHRVASALSAGRHLLLVGPPGTGKTQLAQAIARAAKQEGYCSTLLPATASADWSSFEVVGGYTLQKDGSLGFRPGVFLRALEEYSWLLIDEVNRADADRAFGELMTVLAGSDARTPYEDAAGRFVSIGTQEHNTHQVPKTFRLLATMNSWDKTSLFRMSYALQRRFAIVSVDPPDPATYAGLIRREATGTGADPALDAPTAERIVDLFSPKGLLASRPLGPAIPLEMVRYMRRRAAGGDGLAESMLLYLLPQLEGLEDAPARRAHATITGALRDYASQSLVDEVHRALQEMFPQLDVGNASA